jgi:hypothetical protein
MRRETVGKRSTHGTGTDNYHIEFSHSSCPETLNVEYFTNSACIDRTAQPQHSRHSMNRTFRAIPISAFLQIFE